MVPEITLTTMESAGIVLAALQTELQHSLRCAFRYVEEPSLHDYYVYRAERCRSLVEAVAAQFSVLWDAEIGTPETLAIPSQHVQ